MFRILIRLSFQHHLHKKARLAAYSALDDTSILDSRRECMQVVWIIIVYLIDKVSISYSESACTFLNNNTCLLVIAFKAEKLIPFAKANTLGFAKHYSLHCS